jgi:tetratricopeptide (TPR) repeat protein
MSKEKQTAHHEDNFEQIEEVLTSSEQFIEKYQKQLSLIAIAIILVVVGYMGYQKFYKAPLEKEATEQIAGAQLNFSNDSYKVALEGDGNKLGFIDILNNYSSTKVGNTAKAYAGVCYLKLGQFDKAIELLEGFNSNDFIISQLAIANLGDAYMEKGEYAKAANNYEKAAANNANEFSTPIYLMKAGGAHELNKDFEKAVVAYERIQTEFSKSIEARDIEKYITKANILKK